MPLLLPGRALPGTVRSGFARLAGRLAGHVPAPVTDPADDVVVQQHQALEALRALTRMAEALLSCGASAADVAALTLRAAAGAGLHRTQVDITFTAVVIATVGADGFPLTDVRVVQARATDYSRLSALYELAHEAGEGLEPAELDARLKRLLSSRRPYRGAVASLGAVGLAVSVAVVLGGGWPVAVAAAATTAALQALLFALNRRGLPAFFQQVAGAALATCVALALLLWQEHLPDWVGVLPPSLVVGSGIVVLLAGLSLVGSAEDAISGFYVTAGARAFETVTLTVALVLGIAGVLDIGQRAGITLNLTFAPTETPPALVQVLAGAAAALAWAVSGYADARAIALAAVAGGTAAAVSAAALAAGAGPITAAGLAALLVGLLAEGTAWRWRVPGLVVSVCGIVPLLPGLAIYRAIFTLVGGGTSAGLALLVQALGTALALAAGVTLGEFLSTPLRREFDRVERRVRSRSLNRRF
ncbi:threonine/serine exporter family protein [Paenibacillus sp. TRM 82003]|uniref:threonine/serine exporter family protein n=1 Tax=Kineococcus sp. TRM81007 TaxID=2925831 RepID=UPI001F5775F5|nr:threonine/serine exporter family protein [Kineococcus sp. TRM81007]MCI2238507.1 threonine/serine exporter family protein [Kineococcus sp. TRM81007]MCI3921980.1 threonine/serine exporter family protein [Paenibacillus sp. TRM 82003]